MSAINNQIEVYMYRVMELFQDPLLYCSGGNVTENKLKIVDNFYGSKYG